MSSSTKAPGVRARVRAQLTIEIKESARRQLASDGAASISLRAIAREMEMSSSAIYRYFPSRDDLLTALIIDAYNSVGEAAEVADAAHERTDRRGRLISLTTAIRRWAVANPHEYALIYGSPVPGYAAPEDTVDPATRVVIPLIAVLIEQHLSDEGVSTPAANTTTAALTRAVAGLSSFVDDQVPVDALAGAISAWAEIFGLINLELFGHFHKVVDDPEVLFAHAMGQLADRMLQ